MRLLLPFLHHASDAFLRFYATHLLTVLGLLARMGVRPADVDDLAQVVFVKVYKNFDKVPSAGVDDWLKMICQQQAAEHYRLHRHRFETPEADVGVDVPSDENPHERFEHHELDQVVKRVLQTMDAELVDVLVRAEFNGESLPQIAAALGVSRNTAQARLVEAKDVFRRRVTKLFGRDFTPFMVLPFSLDTVFRPQDLTPDFIEKARHEVWRGVARELGFNEALPPILAPSPSPPSEPPASGERLIQAVAPRGSSPAARATAKAVLEFIKHPLFLVGLGALGGGGAVALWPHDAPPAALHAVPMVLSVVVDEGGRGESSSVVVAPAPTPGPSPTVIVVAHPRPPAGPVPLNDLETTNLEQAREMLSRGQFAEALFTLRQHERDYRDSHHAAVRKKYIAAALEGLRQNEQKSGTTP
ncbi:RNA polymerase sigma factor [Polyangium jinanense]|uniref:Sigma-70 family RNA polymerase sigma factor n=1 Tax=Polyangium jinanense TaxID=2829994 RepID=A0A9X3XC23_9BACT|nr:sigma-70 family RNA polymerase sigma factor [Polyangium jinanense]MDC3959636.1 sigma-70 family RNA polymerase sigma factor [Polyangium jinanense]MDC3986515.1 sigma-70 family RNA polymerase sigma factor [Polyangium jinanense]